MGLLDAQFLSILPIAPEEFPEDHMTFLLPYLLKKVMLEHFFRSHERIQALREGPRGSLLEGFAEELRTFQGNRRTDCLIAGGFFYAE
jgi:hypothetical protein